MLAVRRLRAGGRDQTEPARRAVRRLLGRRCRATRKLLVGLALVVSGCGNGSGDEDGSAFECIATPRSAAMIEEGLTASGASLVDPYAVELTEPNDLGVNYLVATEIDDANALAYRGEIGVWGVGELDSGPIFAMDGFAQEFTDWGAAAEEGSPADQARKDLQSSDEADAVAACVGSQFNPYRNAGTP
jgi:hypothetical protein